MVCSTSSTTLVVTNNAPTPAALTVVEVLTLNGRPLLRLDGAALVAATQQLDRTEPAGEIPASTAVAVVIDLRLATGQPVEQLTHRVGYEGAGALVGPVGGHQVSGSVVTVDPRTPVVLAPPLSGPGWLAANSCCDAFTTHRAGRTPLGGDRFSKTETFAVDWIQLRGESSGTVLGIAG